MQGDISELSAIAGDYKTKQITISTSWTSSGLASYTLRYRDILAAIRFFLGHPGFEKDLVYEPYRMWSTNEARRRIYSDIALANW